MFRTVGFAFSLSTQCDNFFRTSDAASQKHLPDFFSLRRVLPIVLVVGLSLTVNVQLLGQTTQITDIVSSPQSPSAQDFIQYLNESVNPANGMVSLHFELPVPQSRGITPPLSFDYSSGGMVVLGAQMTLISGSNYAENVSWADNNGRSTVVYPGGSAYPIGGWSYSIPTIYYTLGQSLGVDKPTPWECNYEINVKYSNPEGEETALSIGNVTSVRAGSGGAVGCLNGGLVSGFGGQYVAHATSSPVPISMTVQGADGTLATFVAGGSPPGTFAALATKLTDRNGNVVTYSYGTTTLNTTIKDTSGRPAVAISGYATANDQVSISGFSTPFSIHWARVPISYNHLNVYPLNSIGSGCSTSVDAVTSSREEVSSISLPNGQSYSFEYEAVYGLLSRITYPNGGYVRYVWGINTDASNLLAQNTYLSCTTGYDVPVITDRFVSFDGTTEVHHDQFTYLTSPNGDWTNKTTQVTSTDLKTGNVSITKYSYSKMDSGGATRIPGNGAPTGSSISSLPTYVPVQTQAIYQNGANNTLKTVNETWWDYHLPLSETVTLDGNGATSQTSFAYNGSDQIQEQDNYDYGAGAGAPGPLIRKILTAYTSIPTSSALPSVPGSVQVQDGNGVILSATIYCYDQISTSSTSSQNVVQHDYTNFPSTMNSRGNLTQKMAWINPPGGSNPIPTCPSAPTSSTSTYASMLYTYDDTGQPRTMTDPNGNVTQYSFTDSPLGGNPAGNSNAYLTTITRPTTNGVPHIETFQYSYGAGELTGSTDENGQTTNYTYTDPLNRLKEVLGPPDPVNNNQRPTTMYGYSDGGPNPTITTSTLISAGPPAITKTTTIVMDGIGHPIHSQLNSDPVSTVYVDTTYDGEGNVATVSNPYRFTSDPTYGVTTYTHDALNRVTLKTNPGDNSTESWSYSGNGTTFKDEDGNSWTRTYDSFGRLTNVIEPTGETTGSYAYNALDDLTGATHGTQPRSFSYDSLSRLTSAFNPETGTISYSYDNNGNILTKRDARGITTTYCPYDALNRVICKSYSDGTPTVSYAYDKPDAAIASYAFGNFKGRLGGAYLSQSGVPLENYLPEGYDAMGRPYGYVECPGTSSCVANNNGNAVIASGVFYDLAGDAMANSAGVVHTIAATTAGDFAAAALSTYDTAEHLNSIVGETETFTAPGQGNPSTMSLFSATSTNPSAPAYGPMGLMNVQLPSNSTTQPTPINISRTYDKRGRILTETDLGGSAQSPIYQYALGYDPVGNVTSFNDFVMGNWTAGYSVNRLISSSASVGIYSNINFGWTYDSLGNRLTQTPSGSGQTPVPTAQTLTYNGNNQINGLVYDAAGNLTDDGTSKYLYDGEGRLCAVYHYQVPISQTQYIYDAMGRRVGKGSISSFSCNVLTNGFSLSNEYVYGLDGKQLVETSGWFAVLHSNFFANGQLLATNNGANWYYNLNDWVGTKRVVANMSGSINVEYASLPYGDGQTTVNYYGSDDTEHHFTGKERDPESGNDYFGARYYSSNMGRWMSPDPKAPSAKTLMNPQKWNKYNYVLNNPLSMFDPDGLVEMTVQLRAYIPQGHVFMYRGDNRGPTASQASNVTSRTSITLRIETDPSKSSTGVLSNPGGQAGTTHNDLTGNFGTQTVGVPKAQVGRDGNGNVVITIKQDAANPLTPQGETPGIKSDLTVSIPVDGSSVTTSGTLSGAPAFELNVGTPGNSMTNIPLQGASSNSFLFLNDLRQTNKLPTTTTPLPAPCQGSNCHQ